MNADNITILLVEDDEDDFLLFKTYVSKLPYRCEIVWANSYSKGHELLKTNEAISLCFVDYRLGKENGIDFIKDLKRSNISKPVIMLTSQEDEELGINAVRAGAEDFYNKSFITVETVNRAIRFTLERIETQQQKILLNEAQKNVQFLTNVFDKAPSFMAVVRGKDHIFEMANPAFYELIGKDRYILDRPIREALPELENQDLIEELDIVYKRSKPHTASERQIILKRGKELEERYINFVYQPMYESATNNKGILIHGIDITEQVVSREEVKIKEQQYATLFNSIDEGFCVIEMIFDKRGKVVDYRFLEVNPSFETQSGLKNALGKRMRELIPEHEDHWFKIYGEVAKTGESIRFENSAKALAKYFDVYATKVGEKKSNKVAVVFNDITEKKNAEIALKKSEEFNRSLIESSPDCIKGLDLHGNLLSMNSLGQQLMEIDDFMPYCNTSWSHFWKGIYKEKAEKALALAKSGKVGHFQGICETGKGTQKWWDVMVAPVYGDGDTVERLVAVSRDITALKELERQKDIFLGIASHELKTPVTSIKAYTQVLERLFERKGDMKSAEQLSKMNTQVDKLSGLISDLLDVTKIQSGQMKFNQQKFDFNEVIHEIIEEVQRTTTTHTILPTLVKNVFCYGDRERIGQVITNLLTNAIKYSPSSETVVITTSVEKNNVKLSVKDFGIGIPTEKQNQVFDQFYRVSGSKRETFPGLGLGLFISKQIIARSGGILSVSSAVGKGSTFYFTLPKAA